jgi:hypothetical protein
MSREPAIPHQRPRLVFVVTLLALNLWSGASAETERRFVIDLEGGPVWQTRNNLQIPNDASGTRFSLVDLAGKGPWPVARLDLAWRFNRRHSVHALLAPLSYTETGQLKNPVDFAGVSYAAGIPAEATYQFNSWRVGYRYRFNSSEQWKFTIGFTAKLRDAKIELRQGSLSSKDTDVGFVPLLHVGAEYHPSDMWYMVMDCDGLAGGPGRAFDASLKVGYEISDRLAVAGGYRTLEGGADVDAVYNFAWLHYAVVSVVIRP